MNLFEMNRRRLKASLREVMVIVGLLMMLTMLVLPARAQAQTAPAPGSGSFLSSLNTYFLSFNTNLDSTFASKGTLWTSADSLQGGDVNLANSLGFSYTVWKSVAAESVTRNSGVAGTLISEQFGLSLSWQVHDVKLSAYADAGYDFHATKDKFYGEVGLRVMKALTEHTFAGVGIGAQLPANRQVFSALVGFTF